MNNLLCPLPFIHSFFDVRGYYTACCNGSFDKDSKHISQISAIDWFHSEEMNQLRNDMLSGNRNKLCTHCWKKDDIGIPSPRLQHINNWKNVNTHNPTPIYFDLKPTNHCNLACIFCTPSSSDKIFNITDELPLDERPQRWQTSFENVKKRQDLGTFDSSVSEYILENIADIKMLKFTGGEPFLSKEVFNIISLASKYNPSIEIKITSNGTVITKQFYPILQKMEKVSIKLSIDAVDALYSYIRWPSEWNLYQTRLENIMASLPNIKFNVNCLVSNMCLEQLPKIRAWFIELQEKYSNLEYIIVDPNLHPEENESSLYMMTKSSLESIKDYLLKESQKWSTESKTDRQFLNVFKKIDDAINRNKFNKDIVHKEFTRQNKIREMNIIDVVDPLTKQFFKEAGL